MSRPEGRMVRALLLVYALSGTHAGAQSAAQSTGTRKQALDSLTAVLTRLDESRTFHGTVLISDSGRTVHLSAHGLAHEGYQVPNRVDTKFNLASVGKTFTAVAIGQLVSQGKLKFTDTLARVLPDYPNRAIAAKVTIDQLLSHRSGLGLYWDELFRRNWTAVRTTQALTPFFANTPLAFEPGSRWSYSNTGFAILALVIEKISGENYFAYIKRHLLDPAGMTDTDFHELDRDVPNLAVGYFTDDQGVLRNNLFTHTVRGGGAGGGWSTAPDLLKWAEALRSGKVLDPVVARQMMTRVTDTDLGSRTGYGYGFMLLPANDRQLTGHTGGFEGIVTRFFFDSDRGRVGVVMSNHPGPTERQVWGRVLAYLIAN